MEVIIRMTIGEKLKCLREEKGISVDEMAKELDLTRQAVYNYESNSRIPRDEIKVKIAQYFKKSVEEIFFDTKATECCKL